MKITCISKRNDAANKRIGELMYNDIELIEKSNSTEYKMYLYSQRKYLCTIEVLNREMMPEIESILLSRTWTPSEKKYQGIKSCSFGNKNQTCLKSEFALKGIKPGVDVIIRLTPNTYLN